MIINDKRGRYYKFTTIVSVPRSRSSVFSGSTMALLIP